MSTISGPVGPIATVPVPPGANGPAGVINVIGKPVPVGATGAQSTLPRFQGATGPMGSTGPTGAGVVSVSGVTGVASNVGRWVSNEDAIALRILESLGLRPGDRLLVRRGGRTTPLACKILDESAAGDVIDE